DARGCPPDTLGWGVGQLLSDVLGPENTKSPAKLQSPAARPLFLVNYGALLRSRPPAAAAEMEQHVQFGSFTSPPVARRGARRSPAAWLSVLPRQPGRPSNNRPDCRVVPAGDRLCRRQADRDPDRQARSRAALDRRAEGPARRPGLGVAIGRQLDGVVIQN